MGKARLQRSRHLLVPVALAMMGSMTTFAPAAAEDDHDPVEARVLTPEESLREDAQQYAREFEVTLAEAERRLIIQSQLPPIFDSIERAAPDRFGGAWVEHQPEYRIVARFTGNDDAALDSVRALASSAPIPIHISSGARHTWAELIDAQAAIGPRLEERLPAVATDIDAIDGSVIVQVPEGSAFGSDVVAELAAIAGVPIRVEAVSAPIGDGHTYGGKNLSTCTTGFTVRNSAGTTGVLTAAHCDNVQTYYESSTVSYPVNWVAKVHDADQDVEWHTTSHPEYPQFNANGSLRTVTGTLPRTSQDIGYWVCHQGRTTGYSCGNITSLTYQPTYAGACPNTTCSAVWIKVESTTLECYGGDSGGPWFNNGLAYGIYKGQSSSGTTAAGCNFAFYMGINYVSGLGVSLMTN